MSERRNSQILWAVVLVVGGALLLVFNYGLLQAYEPLAQWIAAGALALGGLGFFLSVARTPAAWWRLIPAWTLVALAAMVMLGTWEAVRGPLVAGVLFWGLGLAFAHIYLRARGDNWWAILPGGFLTVLGVVFALSGWVQSLQLLGAVLFGGLGLVFLLLAFVGGRSRHWWALGPGSILLLFGLFVLGGGGVAGERSLRWWPALVIVAGLLIGWRALRAAPAPKMEVNRAPALRSSEIEARPMASAAGASIQVLDDPDV
jgi:hypothetical protein